SGKGAEAYMQLNEFSAQNIKVDFQQFTHPVYPQKNSANFIPGIACLDVLFNVGPQQATGLIHA
ncbi:MAG TPA: WbqC family protein, partial [Ferruginibacter sp.]|nr:WbqC family protein [Ferruginibacter sp.]